MQRSTKRRVISVVVFLISAYLLVAWRAGEGPGHIVKPNRNVQVTALIAGTITRAARVGQAVAVGDVLAEVSTSLGHSVTARSPFVGRVARTYIERGQTVEVGEPLFIVSR